MIEKEPCFFYFILSCFYFFLPALISNMMASLTRKIPFLRFLNISIDFNKSFKGGFVLGPSKTWRGIIFGPFFGFGIVLLQSFLYQYTFFEKISLINYHEVNLFLFGFLMCFGALFGDLIFSFFKRRKGIQSGESWIPFDQLDFVVGSFLFLTPYLNFVLKLNINIFHWLAIAAIAFLLHVISNNIGYYTGLQKNKW